MLKFLKSLFGTKVNETYDDMNKELAELIKETKAQAAYNEQFDVTDINTISKDDHLGLAENANYCAKLAMKNKDYKEAWSLFQERKDQFYTHTQKQDFSFYHTTMIVADVHEDFANILRLEGNHKQAFVDMIFCVAGEYPTVKYKAKKLPAYFNRAKLNDVPFEEVEEFIYSIKDLPDYAVIQKKVEQ